MRTPLKQLGNHFHLHPSSQTKISNDWTPFKQSWSLIRRNVGYSHLFNYTAAVFSRPLLAKQTILDQLTKDVSNRDVALLNSGSVFSVNCDWYINTLGKDPAIFSR